MIVRPSETRRRAHGWAGVLDIPIARRGARSEGHGYHNSEGI